MCKKTIFRNKKLFKAFGAGGLALFMGIGTLFGVLIAPAGAAQAAISSQPTTQTASPLGLDPENDPVVFTTASGLEIKYASALSNSNLTGYTYFTMGKYNNHDVNWLITGYDSTMSALVGDFSGEVGPNSDLVQGDNSVFSTLDDSPAGFAILKDNFAISSLAVECDDIGDGCVYCVSECILFKAQFNTGSSSNYNNSNLQSVCQKMATTLGLSTVETNLVVPVTVKYRINTNTDYTVANQKFFAPGMRIGWDGSMFFGGTDALTVPVRIAYNIGTTTAASYWARDGYFNSSYCVYYSSSGASHNSAQDLLSASATSSLGVRPCCVVRLV